MNLHIWGTEVPSQETPETKQMLGVDLDLTLRGLNGDEARIKKEATRIIDHHKRGNRNARQTMLQQQHARGAGCMPTFPTELEIAEAMEGYADDKMIQVYGDGSLTTPTNWWAALGGFRAWIPNWNLPGQDEPHRTE